MFSSWGQETPHKYSEEQLRELAERCTFFHTRVVGKFCPLDYDGILAVYRMANK